MAGSGKVSGLLSMLVLWGVVLAFGVLYLVSISGRDGAGEANPQSPQPVAEVQATADGVAALRPAGVGSQASEAVQQQAVEATGGQPPAGTSMPHSPPSSVSARVADDATGTGMFGSLPVRGPIAQPVGTGLGAQSSGVDQWPQAVVEPAPQVPSVAAETSSVRDGTPSASAEATAGATVGAAEVGRADQMQASMPAPVVPIPAESLPHVVPAAPAAVPAQSSASKPEPPSNYARSMAEHEAARRRAQEEMRKRWGQGRSQGQYSTYPGYYAPGYYPQRQP